MAVKITDLIDPGEIEKLKQLDTELMKVLDTYTNVAKELAKGLEINVKVVGDIDKLQDLLAVKSKEAAEAQKRMAQAAGACGTFEAATAGEIGTQPNTHRRRKGQHECRNELCPYVAAARIAEKGIQGAVGG